jgi:hypothetical protein
VRRDRGRIRSGRVEPAHELHVEDPEGDLRVGQKQRASVVGVRFGHAPHLRENLQRLRRGEVRLDGSMHRARVGLRHPRKFSDHAASNAVTD